MKNRLKNNLFFLIIVSLLLPILGCTSGGGYVSVPPEDPATSKSGSSIQPSQEDPALDTTADTIFVLGPLEDSIKNRISLLEGDWSVYIKDLSSGETISINSHKGKAASLTKLFIMVSVYQQVKSGLLPLDGETKSLLYQMITASDNEASNTLVAKLGNGDFKRGMAFENRLINDWGYKDSEQQRDMKDWRDKPVEGENYTSVMDCGELLEKIYKGECVSKEFDRQMLDMMLEQTRRGKIPAGLPNGVMVANKTGELSDTENDVAVVYTANGDYILCVLASGLKDTDSARVIIAEISAEVYEYIASYDRAA
ncbi:MAG: class A beta-lactamase-related serine hydrolase [Eggerthellaceae bacterium]|nr:class A beta-lactamase-related serine hydrolase [Eggerthellaceae bacterium]